MTQRTLFPTMTTNGFFCGIYLFVLSFGFLVCFIGSYFTEIGERIPCKPQLERAVVNLESRYDTTYTRAIILKHFAEDMERGMDRAYEALYTPLKDWGNKSYYNYYYLEVGDAKTTR